MSELPTKREKEIAELISLGLYKKEVAAKLNVSLKTVEVHMNNLFKRLKVHSGPQMVRVMFESGYLQFTEREQRRAELVQTAFLAALEKHSAEFAQSVLRDMPQL